MPRQQPRETPIAVVAICCLLIGAITGGGAVWLSTNRPRSTGGTKTAKPKQTASDPVKLLVRNYLQKNTPTGQFVEIEWFPTLDKQDGKAARLKYRTKNPLGGTSLIDEVFGIQNGRIVWTEANGDRRIWWNNE